MSAEVPISPLKSLVDELEQLRKQTKQMVAQLGKRLAGEIVQVTGEIRQEALEPKISGSKVRDARDMLSLLRNLEVRPEKGRRRDLKRVEQAIEEVRQMLEKW